MEKCEETIDVLLDKLKQVIVDNHKMLCDVIKKYKKEDKNEKH